MHTHMEVELILTVIKSAKETNETKRISRKTASQDRF